MENHGLSVIGFRRPVIKQRAFEFGYLHFFSRYSFIAFVRSAAGQQILKKHNFIVDRDTGAS